MLLVLILAPSVSMASTLVKCGDGIIRKSCCCNKNVKAQPPCEQAQLRRQSCCERVELAAMAPLARDLVRAEFLGPNLVASDVLALVPLTFVPPPAPAFLARSVRPPTGPPVYLTIRTLLI